MDREIKIQTEIKTRQNKTNKQKKKQAQFNQNASRLLDTKKLL